MKQTTHLALWKASWDGLVRLGRFLGLKVIDGSEEDRRGPLVEAIMKAKPSGAKGQYIKSAFLTTTMGPGIRLDLRPLLA